jgi:hypothetical protein
VNDQQLSTALRSIHTDSARHPDSKSVVRDVMSIPFYQIPQRRSFVPQLTSRFQSMFSATKFVAAGVIVALFGGFLLIAQPFEQQGELAPGAASAGPGTFSPAGSLAEARENHTATLLSDGRVLVVGGWGGGDFFSSAEVWEPSDG